MAATGPDVHVRRLRESDEAAFVAAAQRSAEFHQPWVSPPTTEEAFQNYYLRSRDGNTAYAFVIEAKVAGFDDPQLVGYINIRQIEKKHYSRGILGYATFVPYQRKGYMKAGLNQLVDIAFSELGLHRLEAEVQPHNKASINLVRKVRFRFEAYLPKLVEIGDARRDHRLWVMDVRRWAALDERVLRRPAPLARVGEWLSLLVRMPEVPLRRRTVLAAELVVLLGVGATFVVSSAQPGGDGDDVRHIPADKVAVAPTTTLPAASTTIPLVTTLPADPGASPRPDDPPTTTATTVAPATTVTTAPPPMPASAPTQGPDPVPYPTDALAACSPRQRETIESGDYTRAWYDDNFDPNGDGILCN